ncbi:DAK2 domain-containing protein [Clostridium sp. AM58-1XD]|uniref:DAK2 domain-containing protein n=1 Tax=Clostridium sp. AM58-1XD TaxID=2292307 RepID=UPI000E505DC6|nr:DAK2 domain-containing protein [Clostridium sp. AM58-1XD]RGY96448.1 DAK2 domain-containing protein [Clostridium sp. AM58-1XD]
MLLLKAEIIRMFRSVSQIWEENKDFLSEIDSRFGDGDHGVTIGKIAGLIGRSLDGWENDDIETFLEDLGDSVMEIGGGSAGPLYGTMIGGLSEPLSGGAAVDAAGLKAMFAGSLSAMEDITKAKVGDKTMMDALIPAVAAAQEAPDDILEILKAAAEAAEKGARESEKYVSKFGRARSYKEQTIGTPDAGAVSTSLFFKGLYKGLRN